MDDRVPRPVEVILARAVMPHVGSAAVLIDISGQIVYFNDAAATLLGVRFENAAAMDAAEFSTRFMTFDDDDGRPLPAEERPLMIALYQERPAYRRVRLRLAGGEERRLEVSAIPIVGAGTVRGAIAIFWEVSDGAPD